MRFELNDIKNQIFNINDSLSNIGKYFLRNNIKSTIYIEDDCANLIGIISIGDFLRKIHKATCLMELVNINFIKFQSEIDEIKLIDEIFAKYPNINEVPEVINQKLVSVYKRHLNSINLDIYDKIIKLRDRDEDLKIFFKWLNIQTINIIGDNEVLILLSEYLNKYINCKIYKSSDDFLLDENKTDMDLIVVSNLSNLRYKMFYFNIINLNHFFEIIEIALKLEKISALSNSLYLFSAPRINEITKPSEKEINNYINQSKNYDILCPIKDLNQDEKNIYINEVIKGNSLLVINNDYYLPNYNGKYLNVINNKRYTKFQNNDYKYKIYVLGDSVAYGRGCEDKNTVPSLIQKYLNYETNDFLVVNCGVIGGKISLNDVLDEIKKGDIVIVYGYFINIFRNITSLSYLFNRPHNFGEVFWDDHHLNYIGNDIVAKEIVKTLRNNDKKGLVIKDGSEYIKNRQHSKKYTEWMNLGLSEYLNNISAHKVNDKNIGAIVLNCNPFTNGHAYLIEYSAKQVDHLFLFVVEEDKSFFKFTDRLMLVKEGTKHIKNITVISSGKFIISSLTFEDYFDKDALNGVAIDPTMDIEIFANYIAPTLNIKQRFVGEEPNCNVTNQYNINMKEILPQYGIKLIEIPRRSFNDQPISASTVRKLIKEKNIDMIKEIVPQCTYNFIMENYF